MTDPRPTGRLFDAWAEAGRAEGMEEGHLRAARPVLEAQDWRPGMRVLDLGCGNAWAARHAHAVGAEAVAVDLSRKMVRKAASSGVAGVQVDMQHLPFGARSFDALWSMEALYYAPDPDLALREAHRVLRPGAPATVLLDHFEENPDSHGWSDELGVFMERRTAAQWVDALVRAGFADVQAARIGTGTLHLSATA